ncbi:hypothetical protein FJZ31_36800 [Candidatus Poribacteria bacterium]|nr:hypothetical protein [Candidatus Poribacteria bacterium]
MKRLLLPNFSLRKKSLIKRNNWNRNNWNRKVWLPFIITTITWLYLSGCQAGILSKFFEEQQWSENYALLEGVTCTTPEMIDGDMNTVGISGRHEVIITLPERKSIHRILIRGTNIEDYILYASKGSEDNWKQVGKKKNNKSDTIDIRVSAVTDKLRFRIGGTFDDVRRAKDPYAYQLTGQRDIPIKRAAVSVREIELYGFAEKEKKQKEGEYLF